MGIFGRDEQTPPADPAPPAGTPSQPTAVTPGDRESRTVIARPTRVEGRILGSGEILVDGEVEGAIEGTGTVQIAEHGGVEASVHARNVVVAGRVKGNISANQRIELQPSAFVEGNITAPRILIRDGATFKGQVMMKEPNARGVVTTSSARKQAEAPPAGKPADTT
ncbi:MAG: polymer-forming cytoskeletal protein [Acidobacteriota bacterium]